MDEEKRRLKVFLCHAHGDKEPVRRLYLSLVKDGIDAWLDKEKLIPGQDWRLEIEKAVHEADVVVVCLSRQFNQEGYRQKEVRLALDTAQEKPEGEIFVIPAKLEECDRLDSLAKWHEVDLFDDRGYELLVNALKTRAKAIGVNLQALQIKNEERIQHSSIRPKPVSALKQSPQKTPRLLLWGAVLVLSGLFCISGAAVIYKYFLPPGVTPTNKPTEQIPLTEPFPPTDQSPDQTLELQWIIEGDRTAILFEQKYWEKYESGAGVPGLYLRSDDINSFGDYIELNSNGTFTQEENRAMRTGNWYLEGEKITLVYVN